MDGINHPQMLVVYGFGFPTLLPEGGLLDVYIYICIINMYVYIIADIYIYIFYWEVAIVDIKIIIYIHYSEIGR